MKIVRCSILIFFATAFLANFSGQAAEKTPFNGTETFTGSFLDFGKAICPGSEPSGQFPPCPAGSRTHIRGLIRVYQDDMTDARASGTNVVTENWNLNENFIGPMWGTYRLLVGPDAFWEGTWTGKWFGTSGRASMRGHGGGTLEGLEIRVECDYLNGLSGPCVGEILDPAGK